MIIRNLARLESISYAVRVSWNNPIGHFQKYHNTLCLSSKILHIKHCSYFLFSLDCKSQEKIKTMLMGNFGGQTKSIMVLIIFRKWPILLREKSKILKGVI